MKKYFLLIISFLLMPFESWATGLPSVIINEVAWMGTIDSANNEWFELKNNTDQNINLEGWTLGTADGNPEIKLTGNIPANGFYLLERTDDSTITNIVADMIYKGALGNNGEDLWLYDSNNNLIDEVDCTEKWFAGDNTKKQTMEKTDSGWQTSENVGGTPKVQNSQNSIIIDTPLSETPKDDKIVSVTYPTGIIFSEILPSPEGADEQNEWIEIYNTNNVDIDLSGWKIKDKEGSITNFLISKDTKMPAYGYLVFKRPETKITLNNTTDGLFLSWPNDKIVDSVTFEKAPINQTYNRIGTNWQWSISLTPGTKNIINNDTKQDAEGLPKIEKSVNNKEINVGLATINQGVIKNANPWFLFLAAVIITIFSAIIVLLIKFKFHPVK